MHRWIVLLMVTANLFSVALPTALADTQPPAMSQPATTANLSKSEREKAKQEFAKKDATIAALRSQLVDAQNEIGYLRHEVEQLKAAASNVQSGSNSARPNADAQPSTNAGDSATSEQTNDWIVTQMTERGGYTSSGEDAGFVFRDVTATQSEISFTYCMTGGTYRLYNIVKLADLDASTVTVERRTFTDILTHLGFIYDVGVHSLPGHAARDAWSMYTPHEKTADFHVGFADADLAARFANAIKHAIALAAHAEPF